MDANGHIYMSADVPAEDKARLDGYLRGRAEADKNAVLERLEQRIRELEAERDAA